MEVVLASCSSCASTPALAPAFDHLVPTLPQESLPRPRLTLKASARSALAVSVAMDPTWRAPSCCTCKSYNTLTVAVEVFVRLPGPLVAQLEAGRSIKHKVCAGGSKGVGTMVVLMLMLLEFDWW